MTLYKYTLIKDGKGRHITFPPFVSQKDLDALRNNFVVKEDDVFVVAYPKSGTTWLEQIVHLLLNNGIQGEKVLSEAVPWLEGSNSRYGGLDCLIASFTARRCFHTHLPLSLMPDLKRDRGKYIYIARNPKDNAVSFYFHACSKLGFDGTWQEFFELYILGKVGYGSFFDHVLEWWEASQNYENILFVKYEDLKHDLFKEVEKIAQFIAIKPDRELIASVVAQSSFQAMAANPKANLDWVSQRSGFPKHMRKGIIGDWRNYFSEEQNQVFDRLYLRHMQGSGLEFDFGEGAM